MARSRLKPLAIGVKAPFPGFIKPALASSIEKVPSGERWVHEIKFDGYRVQLHLANQAVTVVTRRGHDWTKRFRVADDAWHINAGSAIIDGEVVVPALKGRALSMPTPTGRRPWTIDDAVAGAHIKLSASWQNAKCRRSE
jgi:bifunctional non-homologous end joining protein LigD